MIDYSRYKKNNIIYTGSEEKFGIDINEENYIVKFQKNSETGLLNNHISEHIGSNIFNILGEEAQMTLMGKYDGKEVVLCKDFIRNDETFIPFDGVGESSLERNKELYQYTYDDIIIMLKENIKLTNVNETIDTFWNMYIIDALIGNFDRHGSNWGFIKSNQSYRIAPIFDNGSSLFPRRTSPELMEEAMNNQEIIYQMTYIYPTSQIRIGNKKSSYFDVINSLSFLECNNALSRIYNKIDINRINHFIDTLQMLSPLQKEFYRFIILHRYDNIIKKSYLKLQGEKNE